MSLIHCFRIIEIFCWICMLVLTILNKRVNRTFYLWKVINKIQSKSMEIMRVELSDWVGIDWKDDHLQNI